jgi:soluble lytic murein transglycosylase-like protein
MIQTAIIGAVVVAILLLLSTTAQAGTGAKHFAFVWHVNRQDNLGQLITASSNIHGIRPATLAAVIYVESRGNPVAVNPADPSYGIGQMTLETARSLSKDLKLTKEDLLDRPEFALDLTALYLSILQGRYGVKYPLNEWLQSYNVGETKFDKGTRNQAYGAKLQSLADGSQAFLQTGQIAQEFERAGVGL